MPVEAIIPQDTPGLIAPFGIIISCRSPKGLFGFTDEQQKLIFWNSNYGDALAFGFDSQEFRRLIAWYEERLGQLLLVRLPLLQ